MPMSMATPTPYDPYTNNPLIHRDRRLGESSSSWVRSFACDDMRVLIICRGPIVTPRADETNGR